MTFHVPISKLKNDVAANENILKQIPLQKLTAVVGRFPLDKIKLCFCSRKVNETVAAVVIL